VYFQNGPRVRYIPEKFPIHGPFPLLLLPLGHDAGRTLPSVAVFSTRTRTRLIGHWQDLAHESSTSSRWAAERWRCRCSGGRARHRAVRGGHGGSRSGKGTFLRHVCAECFGLVIFEGTLSSSPMRRSTMSVNVGRGDFAAALRTLTHDRVGWCGAGGRGGRGHCRSLRVRIFVCRLIWSNRSTSSARTVRIFWACSGVPIRLSAWYRVNK